LSDFGVIFSDFLILSHYISMKRYLAQTSQKNTYKGMKDTLHDFENKPYILV